MGDPVATQQEYGEVRTQEHEQEQQYHPTVEARLPRSFTTVNAIAMAVIATIATHGVRRRASTRRSKAASSPCSTIPYVIRVAMIMVSSAPFATATSATRLDPRRIHTGRKLHDTAEVTMTTTGDNQTGDDDHQQSADLDSGHHQVRLDRLADPLAFRAATKIRNTMAAGTIGTLMKVRR